MASWETPALASYYIGLLLHTLLHDICSYCVSRDASVNAARKGLLVAFRDLATTIFLPNFSDLKTLRKLNTETSVRRIKFGVFI